MDYSQLRMLFEPGNEECILPSPTAQRIRKSEPDSPLCKILQNLIEERFERKPDFLYGGLSRSERMDMVDDFQNDPSNRFLLLSLKAAGTGLNLTAANNVIHFDLWWNPAVENQATDRAYRIGQRNKVQVYRFICANTFEERINAMIQSKRDLADLTVTAGESWLGKLSDRQLNDLFSLHQD